jgi:hypothetical protein
MDVACIDSSAYFNCSLYVIVFFIIIAVPPWAVPSGWFVQQSSYPGMGKWFLDVKCVSLISSISIWFCFRKSVT